ncbi:MAG TPA: hypothetical protein DEA50_08850 [Parvularcula sp.]|nr:hypothetical protein [Parvularcula sp.]
MSAPSRRPRNSRGAPFRNCRAARPNGDRRPISSLQALALRRPIRAAAASAIRRPKGRRNRRRTRAKCPIRNSTRRQKRRQNKMTGIRIMKTRLIIGAALAGAALFGALAVSFVSAQQTKPAPSAERREIEAIVREVIRDNPEIIVEALNAYSDQQTADAAAAAMPALLKEETGFVAGKNPAQAKVTVVELFDYHCGVCKRATSLVQELAHKDPAVRVIFRELPILRKESDAAARFALAAREQGRYLDYHFALMSQSGVLTEERLLEIAKSTGLDGKKLKADASAPKLETALQSNFEAAQRMRLDGTPSFIVTSQNGAFLRVIPGLDEGAIRTAIAEAKKAKPAG